MVEDKEAYMLEKGEGMSYAHTQRRKAIKRFKKQSERSWYKLFREYVDKIKREMEGSPLGTLQDLKRN